MQPLLQAPSPGVPLDVVQKMQELNDRIFDNFIAVLVMVFIIAALVWCDRRRGPTSRALNVGVLIVCIAAELGVALRLGAFSSAESNFGVMATFVMMFVVTPVLLGMEVFVWTMEVKRPAASRTRLREEGARVTHAAATSTRPLGKRHERADRRS